MKDGESVIPVEVQHGGNGGVETLRLELTGNQFSLETKFLFTPGIMFIPAGEQLLAVYGRRLMDSCPYGPNKYVPRIYCWHGMFTK